MPYSIQSKLDDLLADPRTLAILEKHMPGITQHPQISMAKGFALELVASFSGGLITPQILQAVNTELLALG
jgi:hypothetical protein